MSGRCTARCRSGGPAGLGAAAALVSGRGDLRNLWVVAEDEAGRGAHGSDAVFEQLRDAVAQSLGVLGLFGTQWCAGCFHLATAVSTRIPGLARQASRERKESCLPVLSGRPDKHSLRNPHRETLGEKSCFARGPVGVVAVVAAVGTSAGATWRGRSSKEA